MPVLFGNGVIYAELTYAVYLVFAIPLAGLLLLVLRRPIAAGIGGSVAAMTLTCLLEEYLPFNYSAHANDFIIEQFTPFLVPNCEFKPGGAFLSLIFHVAVLKTVFVPYGARVALGMDTSGSWGLLPIAGFLLACGGVVYGEHLLLGKWFGLQ